MVDILAWCLCGSYDDRWDPSSDLKLALYFDRKAFDHWLEFQRRFLTAVNPYTGMAPINDEGAGAGYPRQREQYRVRQHRARA